MSENMHCKYCEKNEELFDEELGGTEVGDTVYVYVNIAGGMLRLYDSLTGGAFFQRKINFCPMCGRHLHE